MIVDKTDVEQEYFTAIKTKMLPLADGYYIENGKLFFVEKEDDELKKEWDFINRKWILIATLEEQEIYYRSKIIALNKKITEIEASGFGASDLKVELETLKLKHQEVTHLLGLEIDKTII